MATKKSTTSTKAKTKTTKAKSTPRKSTTTAAKAPAKSTTKKVAAVKPVKIAEPKKSAAPSLLSLRRMLIVSSIMFVVLAIAAVFLMDHTSYLVTVGHLAKDELASTESTVFAPAARSLFDVQVRWVVAGTMLLSAVLPVLYVTKMEGTYTRFVRDTRMQPYRWLDLGVTTALMMEVVALLSGVHDLFVLKLVGGLVMTTAILGLIAERQNNAVARPVWSAYLTSLFSGALPWVLVIAYAVSTVLFGEVRAPWYVYALYATTLTGFILVAVNEFYTLKKKGSWVNYLVAESTYLSINITTKIAFAAILIVGLAK